MLVGICAWKREDEVESEGAIGSGSVATVGSPDARNLALSVAEAIALLVVLLAVGVTFYADLGAAFIWIVSAGGSAFLMAVALRTHEVVVSKSGLSRRSWLAIATRHPATRIEFVPGRLITRMPDGVWRYYGGTFALRVPSWESKRLRLAIEEAGLRIEDRRAAR
jgi:hypothetical protein